MYIYTRLHLNSILKINSKPKTYLLIVQTVYIDLTYYQSP